MTINRSNLRVLAPVLAILLALGVSTAVLAQSTAALQGTVLDPQGAAVPKAKVTVRNIQTGVERTTETDDAGIFQVASLPVGTYRLEIRREGFQTLVVPDLKLDVSTTVSRTFELKVGEVTQTVEVASAAPIVEASTITVGQVIDQATVQEIPLNGRHFVELGLLIPGSVTAPQNGFLTAPLRGQGSFQFNTAGNREDTVNFMINGINLNDMVQNQITFQPTIDTVQEFKVDNSTFSAEYGRNSGAIVNIATRSGTNDFHGEVYEFLRNNALDARNFFNPTTVPQNPFKRNQFGASGGGPIKRDRVFFFLAYEGLRQRQGITITSGVLSDAQRQQALAANNPTVVKLLTLIPPTNGTDSKGNAIFVGAATAPVDIDQGSGDLDFALTQKDRLHGYYVIQEDRRQEPTLQGNTIPGFGDTRAARRQLFTLNHVHNFGATLTNEARMGLNRIHITFTPNVLLNPADFGINNGITTPIGLPQILIRDIGLNFGGPSALPQGRGDLTGVFSDTVRWLRGRHSFAFGGEVRRFYNNNFAFNIGTFSFATVANTTRSNFINGNADSFTVQIGSGPSRILEPAWVLFFQDSFKWQSNFTWELGFRYDWNSSPSEAQNRFVVLQPISGTNTGSLAQVAQPYHTNNHNFEPRLGFAWDPFKDGKTVVRAAYAILTDQPVTNLLLGLTFNPPFNTPLTFTPTSSTPFVTFANAFSVAGPRSLSPATVNPGFDNAYIQSWNLNIQRAITPTLGVMMGYFGSKGTHLRIQRNFNQPINGGARPFQSVATSSAIRPGASLLASNIPAEDSASNSNYNALWITANKRLSHGLQFNASYTFSKSIDYNSLNSQGSVIVQDSFNIRGDRGLSDFDARHRFVISALYDLPFKGNRLFQGWEVGTIVTAQSGNPLTVLINNNSFTGNFTLRPDIIGTVGTTGDPSEWYQNPSLCVPSATTTCSSGFVFPGTGNTPTHFGNLGRNTFTGPGVINVDFSILKNTKISERLNLQFRTEIFDLLNHPNFGDPGPFGNTNLAAIVGSSTFGIIRSTRAPTGDFGSARQVQFALKLIF